VRPVKDRAHQVNIAGYVPAHKRKGAAVIFLPMAKPRASARGASR
jgi:hypothetical protein